MRPTSRNSAYRSLAHIPKSDKWHSAKRKEMLINRYIFGAAMNQINTFENRHGELVVYIDTPTEKISRLLFGSFYYTAHGMPLSFIYGILFYVLCIWIGTSDNAHTFVDTLLSCIATRTAWHYFTFVESLEKHMTKLGYKSSTLKEVPIEDFHSWLQGKLDADANLSFYRITNGCVALAKSPVTMLLFTAKQ